ncbi:unnamed protein product [Somion occarium]|uniref:Uncharacterized protein n=1 Tax=Somion occarium TaxID=3059160 RepID=A0ABP1D409_9APHY
MEKAEARIPYPSSIKVLDDVEKCSSAEEARLENTIYVADPNAERRLVRRIDIRLLPASMFIYLLCFLDRSNIGNARLLNSATGDSLAQVTQMSEQQYLIALMIFLISYTIFETPSNYMLKKLRPSRWLAFLMLGWGAMTMILGLFPGIIYCLTFWYKPEERALRVAFILACATLGGAFGGAIAFAVGHMNRVGGLQAWRWLFILEGASSCAFAVLTFFFFPDFPETETWLSSEEHHMARDKDTLTDWRLYLHYFVFVSISVPFSSISLFAPTIVSGLGYEGLDAQLFTLPPYALAFVVTDAVAWYSDRQEKRSWGTFSCLLLAGISFLVQGALPPTSFKARYGMLCVAVSFSFASIPPLLSWLMANLRSTGASTLAIPLNVTTGQIGQFIGIYIFKASEAPGYPTGHYTNAAFLIAGAVVALMLRRVYIRRNKALGPQDRAWRL